MRSLILAAATMLAASAAHADATLFSNNFDAENGGNTALNYPGYVGLTDVSGSTDLIKSGDYGINCVGGSGACVDLDGTTSNGAQLNTASFAFVAGRTYTFSFDLSGNQRNFGPDQFFTGFDFGPGATFAFYQLGGGFGNLQIFQGATFTGVTTSSSIADTAPFTTYSIGFQATTSGTFFAYVGTGSFDNVGPVLDNVSLTSDVPEPATWGLMLAGFGLAGVAVRRRSAVAA